MCSHMAKIALFHSLVISLLQHLYDITVTTPVRANVLTHYSVITHSTHQLVGSPNCLAALSHSQAPWFIRSALCGILVSSSIVTLVQ